MVRLSILDLASFRRDGRVRFDKAQAPADELLPSQQKIHAERAGKAEAAINPDADVALRPPLVNEDLALTLNLGDAFKHIRMGAFLPARQAQGGDAAVPDRVTWHLRRFGRIRMPFAASLLEQLLAVMGRRAFDLDFEAD
jgi:hypothetical protein